MRYTKAEVKEAILLLEAEASASIASHPVLFTANLLASDSKSIVTVLGYRNHDLDWVSSEEFWRYSCAEAAALLREGWLPGDDLVNLKTGEVMT